jgi:hypothetical protein
MVAAVVLSSADLVPVCVAGAGILKVSTGARMLGKGQLLGNPDIMQLAKSRMLMPDVC